MKLDFYSIAGMKSEYYEGMVEATFAVDKDHTVSIICEEEVVDKVKAIFCQQAKRIEELEKDLHMIQRHYDSLDNVVQVNQECSSMEENKPAAYWDGKHFASKEKSSLADIPLYTHPHKELSDVVIPLDVAKSLLGITEVPRHKRILESAIIKASRGEE